MPITPVPLPPAPQWPPPQYGGFPGANWLLRNWGDAMQRAPWAVQPGVQPIPHQFPTNPYQGLMAQPVSDVVPFVKKGLLGDPYTEMHEPGAGGRGLLGSKWRDPRFIQQYEVQQGLPPGSIKPPSAEVKQLPTPTSGPTPAQMARPVQQTPEISAKLAQARAERGAKLATATDLEKIGRSMGLNQERMMQARDGAVAAGMTPTPQNIQYWIAQMRAKGLFKPELP